MPASKRKISQSDNNTGTSSPQTTRVTRLTSRVSEFNSRVTILEPSSGPSTSNFDGRLEDNVKEEENYGTKQEPISPQRKRVKLEIPDLEDLAYAPPTTRTPRMTRTARSVKVEEALDEKESELNKSPAKPRGKTKGKAKAIPQALAKPHPAPENWEETYNTIKEMRTKFVAPVDTMGCDSAQTKETDPKNRRYATLVSLMLSSQTKDEVTDAAVKNLRAAFGGSISLESMIAADDDVISQAIAKVGFWRRKTGYLKQTAIQLRDEFNSDLPKTVDELCSLPGVGPKMAFLALQIAWGLNHGIGVDVHVHRITNLLGWHKPPTKNPEQTRLNLQSWLPKHLHGEINHLLVGFGQVICVPVGPKCDQCQLSTKRLCPSARKVVKNTKTKKSMAKLALIASTDDAAEFSDANGKPDLRIEVESQAVEIDEKMTSSTPLA